MDNNIEALCVLPALDYIQFYSQFLFSFSIEEFHGAANMESVIINIYYYSLFFNNNENNFRIIIK